MPPCIDKRPRHFFLLGCFHEAIRSGLLDRAMEVDRLHYLELVRSNEDWSMWEKWQKATFSMRKMLTLKIKNSATLNTSNSCSIGVILALPGFSGLAHEKQISRNLSNLRDQGIEFKLHVAYCAMEKPNIREAAANLYGISKSSIHFIGNNNIKTNARNLENLAIEAGVRSVVFPSLYYFAFWISLFLTRVRSKFLVMKYFPLYSDSFDHSYCGLIENGFSVKISNTEFIQLPVLDRFQSVSAIEAKEKDNETLSFGSISRAEKLSDAGYNRFILSLLDKHSSLTYLFTGQQNSIGGIPKEVTNHPRAKYLGWVDPSEALQFFDIYLDPFPWGGGDMTLLALSLGLPYLTLETNVSRNHVGIQSFLKLISKTFPDTSFSFCSNETIVEEKFEQLILNPELRGYLGHAWKNALQQFKPPIDGWLNLLDIVTP